MITHTPTIFFSVAIVAMTMSLCLILVGESHRRDGMRTLGFGVFAHALAYVCYTLYGHAPLWLTYVVGNTLLSLALSFYVAAIFNIHDQSAPWRRLFGFPAVMLLLLSLLLETREPRMLVACLVLIAQCLLLIRIVYRYAQPGERAHLLLIIGGVISLFGLMVRVVAILSGAAEEMSYAASNLKQTISVSIGTATVIMFSLGTILLARERSALALRHAALRDSLTGIANRRAILEQLDAELARAWRAGTSIAIVLLDIDHFKKINDTCGHLAGDEVLRQCAAHLKRRLRQSDGIGRYGGEEFLLFLPDTTSAGAVAAVDALRCSVMELSLRVEGKLIRLTFSAGIWCGVPRKDHTAEPFIALADVALYEAKAAGRNTIRLAGDQGMARC